MPKQMWFKVFCDPEQNSTEGDQWDVEKHMEFCTSAAIISASIGLHVALSQHLLSFLLSINK